MKPAVSTTALLVLLVAATATRAEEGSAPLSGTKKELQQLQADRNAPGAPSAKDGLNAAAPTLRQPQQSAPSVRRPASEVQRRIDRQNIESGKHWLVEGVAKLEEEEKAPSLRPIEANPEKSGEENAGKTNAVIVDTSDPAYLLKLYDSQKKSDDAKTAQAREPQTPRPDAFAPFLKDWMAASPVKDQILGDLARQNTGTAAPSTPVAGGGPVGVRGVVNLPDASREAGTIEARPNPYLMNPDRADAPTQSGGYSPLLAVPGGAPATAPVMDLLPPVAPVFQPVVEPAVTDRKAPPPPLADDKKYFPQLNRF